MYIERCAGDDVKKNLTPFHIISLSIHGSGDSLSNSTFTCTHLKPTVDIRTSGYQSFMGAHSPETKQNKINRNKNPRTRATYTNTELLSLKTHVKSSKRCHFVTFRETYLVFCYKNCFFDWPTPFNLLYAPQQTKVHGTQ